MDRGFTHLDEKGGARMVDVGEKQITQRLAVAKGRIYMDPAALSAVREGEIKKGDVLSVARIAGIMGAKRTQELIPLCHGVSLEHCRVEFSFPEDAPCIEVSCTASAMGKTGVEMEALTGVQTALLTIYDMVKAMDRGMVMTDICLWKKEGGKTGVFQRGPGEIDTGARGKEGGSRERSDGPRKKEGSQ